MKKTNALRILDNYKINYTLLEYDYDPENLNVKVIADKLQLPVQQVFKTLVVKGNKTGILVAVIGGNRSLDFKELAKKSGNKKTAMVPVKDIQTITGYIRGGCSPIGMKKTFPVLIDEYARHFSDIYVNAGKRGLLFKISVNDLEKISNGVFASISIPL
ncbi:MAG: Cys-tRNA(Pro) deacylase [Bacteroidetes bacterium]|jgi:Cys-tRNA(Pro)/Cys-tRNA(Cys) deacylase|nr:Cys-tRNA(Pro) deacylase [Bacteroidota bacterium]